MDSASYNAVTIHEAGSSQIKVLQAVEFENIYEACFKKVYNFVAYRINNHHDTDELVSQIFEKVITKYDAYDDSRSPVEAWVIGIAKNVVNDYFRKRKRRVFESLDTVREFVTGYGRPDDIAVKNEENEALIRALCKLSDKERTIVSMKYAAELKNKDIAKIMNLSESNIGVILYRSIAKIRKEYIHENI